MAFHLYNLVHLLLWNGYWFHDIENKKSHVSQVIPFFPCQPIRLEGDDQPVKKRIGLDEKVLEERSEQNLLWGIQWLYFRQEGNQPLRDKRLFVHYVGLDKIKYISCNG